MILLVDIADVQADLGFRCPHMLEDTFSHGAVQMQYHYLAYLTCNTCFMPINGIYTIISFNDKNW